MVSVLIYYYINKFCLKKQKTKKRKRNKSVCVYYYYCYYYLKKDKIKQNIKMGKA